MSAFQKLDSRYHELTSQFQDEMTNVFREKLEEIFCKLDIEFDLPAGGDCSYDRKIKAKIEHVYFYLSAPRGEDRILMYKFDVVGSDQRGCNFSGRLSEKQIGHLLPWDQVGVPKNFNLSFVY